MTNPAGAGSLAPIARQTSAGMILAHNRVRSALRRGDRTGRVGGHFGACQMRGTAVQPGQPEAVRSCRHRASDGGTSATGSPRRLALETISRMPTSRCRRAAFDANFAHEVARSIALERVFIGSCVPSSRNTSQAKTRQLRWKREPGAKGTA